jgi:hypothetical protein
MMTFTELAPAASDPPEPFTDRLRLAVAAYLARFKASSRAHTESDLRCYLSWCAEHGLDALAAPGAPHPMDAGDPPAQALHRLPPVLRRGRVLPDLRHRQNHGALTRRARPPSRGARRITHPGILRVCGKGSKVVQVPLPPAVSRAIDRATGPRDRGPILLNNRGTRMDRHAATRRLRRLADAARLRTRAHPHMLRHTFVTMMLDAGVDLRDVQIAARHADPRTTMRYDRARTNLDGHPNYILAAYMSSAT